MRFSRALRRTTRAPVRRSFLAHCRRSPMGKAASRPEKSMRRILLSPSGEGLLCSCAMCRSRLFALCLVLLTPTALRAATFPCKPCAGVRLDPIAAPAETPEAAVAPTTPRTATTPRTPAEIAALLSQVARLEAGSPLYVAWEVPLDGTATLSAEDLQALRQAGD